MDEKQAAIRFQADQWADVEAAAALVGMRPATYIRMAALKQAKADLKQDAS